MVVLKDLRFAIRVLRRSPGFTLAAILILALGIGVNAAIFTLADAVLLKRLAVPDPDALVLLSWACGSEIPLQSFSGNISIGREGRETKGNAFSQLTFEEFRAAAEGTADVFGFSEVERLNVGVGGTADLASGLLVSGNYFSALGVEAALGRTIMPGDDRVGGAEPVAVLSDRYFSRRFGRDPAVLGRVVQLNGTPFTIVGVAPPGFDGTLEVGTSPDLFVPLATQPRMIPGERYLGEAGAWWLQVMARVEGGVAPAQVLARLDPVLKRSASAKTEAGRAALHLLVHPGERGPGYSRGEFSTPIRILMLLVGVVLLVTCANLATLVLARAAARRREIAVRLAIGAGRGRLIRQLLTESVLLATAGGAVGLLLSRFAEAALPSFLPVQQVPFVLDLAPGSRAILFTAAASILTGILFGLVPALRATRVELLPDLKEAPARGGAGRLWSPSNLLVIAQMAMSLVLLVGGGLFVRTLWNLERIDVGFARDRILLFRIDPTLNGYRGDRLAELYARILEDVDALPGVQSASLSRHALLGGGGSISDVVVQGSEGKEGSFASFHTVRPNFLETMGIPLRRGRPLCPEDRPGAPLVAVVNETFARSFFPDQDPLGKEFRLGKDPTDPVVAIVGVAADARNARFKDEIPATFFVPYAQHLGLLGPMTFEVRTAGDPLALVGALREVVERVDPNLPLFDIRTQAQQVERALAQERQFSRVASCFALLGLLLACIGLYGTLSYAASRRTREIGIRVALGARRELLVWMVLREALSLVVIGAVLGLVVSLAAGRAVASLLYGLAPSDPATLGTVVLILAGVSAVAGYLPARRASRVDPADALRTE